jgi:hypothetical protein
VEGGEGEEEVGGVGAAGDLAAGWAVAEGLVCRLGYG